MNLKRAFALGVSALTPAAVVKTIVIGVGSIVLTAMSEAVVEDMMTKKEKK